MPTQTVWKPLSARSVVVSLLLGSHPDPMTAREIVAAGEHLGLPSSTTRVALTRAVGGGDLVKTGSTYQLATRLLARRERQEAYTTRIPWDGTWEMAIVVSTGRPSGERATLRSRLGAARLAELREGVWMRPANLQRPLLTEGLPAVRVFTVGPADDPVGLTRLLWDLDGWAEETRSTVRRLTESVDPAERLAVAAHLVRHLSDDPLLPHELWPTGWPEEAARKASADYEDEIREISRR